MENDEGESSIEFPEADSNSEQISMSNFYEEILNIENKLYFENKIENIEKLISYYKV